MKVDETRTLFVYNADWTERARFEPSFWAAYLLDDTAKEPASEQPAAHPAPAL